MPYAPFRFRFAVSRSLALSSTVALALSAATAMADPSAAPTDDEKAAARLLGTDGVKLAQSGDCVNAVDKLGRAEALVHAPTTAFPLAQCDIKLGRLVSGTELLNRLVREALPANAPKSWVDAKQQAQTLLGSTTPRIPNLRIHVDRPGGIGPDVQVAVDGEAVPNVLLDNDRPTDPGLHRVTATEPGASPAEVTVTLSESQSQSVALQLPAASAPPAPATATATEPVATATPNAAPPPPPPPPAQGPNRTGAYVLIGVGGVGIVVGTVFGVLALGAKSRLESACVNLTCPVSSQSDISAYKTDPIISTIALGIGIVGVGVGALLAATAHGENPPPKTARLELHPWIGPGSAGLGGSFP